jgi:hypothetical protein
MPEVDKKNENLIEHRSINEFEIRVADDGKRYIEGYAIKWEQLSVPIGYYYKFREKFQSGAFDEYLKSGADTKFLVDHDTGKVLGRSNKSTLTLSSDKTGLKYSLEMPSTSIGNDAYEDVRSGNKEFISVGFKMLSELWDESDENNIIRTVVKANLPEISLTAWPAYEQTSASTRSIDDAYKEYRAANPKPEPVTVGGSDKLKEQMTGFNKLRTKIYSIY